MWLICSLKLLLGLASTGIFGSESHRIHYHILLSQISESLNLEDQVPPYLFRSRTMWPSYTSGTGFVCKSESIRVRVTLRLTVSRSVCLGVEPTLWTFNQILLPFQEIGSGICYLVSVGRPLWREAGSVLCSLHVLIGSAFNISARTALETSFPSSLICVAVI
jgi:hypothetical protein